jgi:hypothetical protein
MKTKQKNKMRHDVEFSDIKIKTKDLVRDVKKWVDKKADDTEEKLIQTKITLKEKSESAESKVKKFVEAGEDATVELGQGIKGAYKELKKAFEEAKDKFD